MSLRQFEALAMGAETSSFKKVWGRFWKDCSHYNQSMSFYESTTIFSKSWSFQSCLMSNKTPLHFTSMPSLFRAYSSKLRMAVLMVRGGGSTVRPMLMALLLLESSTMISCRLPSAAVFCWGCTKVRGKNHSNPERSKVYGLTCRGETAGQNTHKELVKAILIQLVNNAK